MEKVQLKIPPFFAYIMDPDTSDWFIIEKEIGKETTIRDFLTDLAANNSGFRDVVFNPDRNGRGLALQQAGHFHRLATGVNSQAFHLAIAGD